MLSVVLVLSLEVIPSQVVAADFSKVGVKTGTTATYSFSASNSEVNRVDLNFTSVAGTTVTLSYIWYNPDGSENSSWVDTGDVSTGGGVTAISAFLIPSNLSAGDPIFSGSLLTINETVSMFTAGAYRTVNHSNWITTSGSYRHDLYWDKQTGLMVRLTLRSGSSGGPYSQNVTLTSTSPWSAGLSVDASTLILIGGVVAAVVVAVAAVSLRRRRR